MTLDELLDAAKAAADLPSDMRLAAALGVARNTIHAYRRGMSMPLPGHVVSLARMAGVPPALALAWRVGWQADTPESREVAEILRQIVAKASGLSALLLLSVLLGFAAQAQEPRQEIPRSIYYGK